MNQPSRSSLITAFFKSPPHPSEKENGDCSELVPEDRDHSKCPAIPPVIEGISPTEVTNDGENSRCSLSSDSMEIAGSDNVGMFSVNLSSLLSHPMGPRTLSEDTGVRRPHSSPLPPSNGLHSVLENSDVPQSTRGSGMRQGSLVWDTSTGKLGLKPAATPTSSSETVGDEGELVVSVKRCHLVQVPGLREKGGSRSQAAPDTGSDTSSDVEVTQCLDPPDLDESCVIVSASSPPHPAPPPPAPPPPASSPPPPASSPPPPAPPPPTPPIKTSSPPPPAPPVKTTSLPSHPTSTSLAGPWAKIFSHSSRQRTRPSTQVSDSVTSSVAVPRTRSPIRSPKRHRSSSRSPRSRGGSRSPHTHRSPARPSPLCSPHKGTSTPASPLKAAVKARKLSFHPPLAKKGKLESDHAPFVGLVHVRQEASHDPLWTLPPTKPLFNFRPIPSAALPASLGPSLKSCLELLGERERPDTCHPLLPVAPNQRDSLLRTLTEAHPQERVQHIFQRYRQIREGNNTPLTSPLPSQQQQRVKQSHRNPLVCSIHVLNHVNRTIKVDGAAYSDTTDRRKSLRLRRKRSSSLIGDCEVTTETRKKRRANINTRSEEGGEVADHHEDRKREAVTDLWSEVYRPQRKDEMIGNKMKVQQLHDWLQRWGKKRSSRQNMSDEVSKHDKRKWRRKLSDVGSRGSRENSPIPEWVHRDGDDDFMSVAHLRRKKRVVLGFESSESEEEEEEERGECEGEEGEEVASVMLLCGPVGSGKTAAVYTCAAELGFKVFEVNSSSVRSRGTLLATLKEATLSHHVSTQPRAAQPLGSITSSLVQPLRVKSPADSPLDRRGRKKKAQEGGLLSFFKPQSEREGRAPPRRKEGTVHRTTSQLVHERQNNSGQVSLETSAVVLLEEVDVLFDSDRGFWSGVYDVIETSRKPIILTCNDSRYDLDCGHVKIEFDPPSLVELGLHAQLLCLSHDCHMTSEAAVELADRLHADIRRVFLSLQFWTTPTATLHPSLHQLAGLPPQHLCREERPTILPPPHLLLPWKTFPGHRATSACYEDMDTAAHCAEQQSYVDTVAMERGSRDRHVMYVDDVMRPWWVCQEECGVEDELPVRECMWGKEMVNGALCEEVKRGVGGGVRSEPLNTTFWTELSRHVGSVRQCLKRCAQLFSPHNSQVGVATDGLPFLRTICRCESHREESRTKRRFRHYLQAAVVDQLDLRTLPLTTRFPIP